MKQLISVILLTAAFGFSSSTVASSDARNFYNDPIYQAPLSIDEMSNNQEYVSADLYIDMEQSEMALTLWGASNCPEGAICIAVVGPLTQTFVANDLTYKRNWCGAVSIEGSAFYEDQIDGQEQQGEFSIKAIDFSKGYCRFFFDVPATAVKFERTFAYVMDYVNGEPVLGDERFQFGDLIGERLSPVAQ